MVFRIGNFEEVHDKKKRATDVVFSSQVKNLKVRRLNAAGSKRRTSFDIGNNGTLQLASLPGIQAFADRALLGFLKSFAGLHRDLNMQNWQKDFRLGAGVSRYKIDVSFLSRLLATALNFHPIRFSMAWMLAGPSKAPLGASIRLTLPICLLM
jgi:hypothetical protein